MDDSTGTAALTPWDVGAWAFGPARPYRINTLFRLDGAVVTVTGRVETPDAAADLASALHVFDPLAAPLFLDLCHATLDDHAARVVVTARDRRARDTGRALQVRHAEPATRERLDRATPDLPAGAVPPSGQPVRPVVATPWVK